jgi:transcription initiation factor TFIIIB Brf1 subunit/transcription initiation factor TFIIB
MNSRHIKELIAAVNELSTFAEKAKIMECLLRLGVVDSFTISNNQKATVSSWQTKHNYFAANPQWQTLINEGKIVL